MMIVCVVMKVFVRFVVLFSVLIRMRCLFFRLKCFSEL